MTKVGADAHKHIIISVFITPAVLQVKQRSSDAVASTPAKKSIRPPLSLPLMLSFPQSATRFQV